jgi:hypothetical protein
MFYSLNFRTYGQVLIEIVHRWNSKLWIIFNCMFLHLKVSYYNHPSSSCTVKFQIETWNTGVQLCYWIMKDSIKYRYFCTGSSKSCAAWITVSHFFYKNKLFVQEYIKRVFLTLLTGSWLCASWWVKCHQAFWFIGKIHMCLAASSALTGHEVQGCGTSQQSKNPPGACVITETWQVYCTFCVMWNCL